jgi:hypothetical protein
MMHLFPISIPPAPPKIGKFRKDYNIYDLILGLFQDQ